MVVSRGKRHGDDRGQVVPLIALLIVLVGATAMGLVAVGGVLIDRAVARSAADAAALAAAAGDDPAAVAADNHAELVRVIRTGDEVEVTVEVGRTQARARARSVRTVVPPSPEAVPSSPGSIP